MRALVWHGKGDVRCDNVPDPKIENDGDVIVKITATAPLLEKIEAGEIDPSFVITHKRPLEDGPELYQTFRDKEDGCIKVVLKP